MLPTPGHIQDASVHGPANKLHIHTVKANRETKIKDKRYADTDTPRRLSQVHETTPTRYT